MSTERIATLKRGRGGAGYRQKSVFLKLWKDADRKRWFCSNVSTLLSMIVVSHREGARLSQQTPHKTAEVLYKQIL